MADVGGIASDRLKSFIERIENLNAEKAALAADIKEIKAEAKSAGFDVATIVQIIKLRKMEPAERQEAEHLLETYRRAIGLDGTPLGDAAEKREAA